MKSTAEHPGAAILRDPFQSLFQTLFGDHDGFVIPRGESNRAPLANISETDAGYELAFELPGIAESDIQVDVRDNTLTVTAERKDDRDVKDQKRKWHRVEHRYGRYSRAISLPRDASSDDVDAVYKNGVLHVTVPKVPAAQNKRIVVRSGER
ncbi:MAG: Hsp20/alpha crystallin family protein [Planctomycetes bacterium]|nr:Hsp20/alpha crystallin family protein [Planctomycetota bacterium]